MGSQVVGPQQTHQRTIMQVARLRNVFICFLRTDQKSSSSLKEVCSASLRKMTKRKHPGLGRKVPDIELPEILVSKGGRATPAGW